jgi:hypothetical protein
MADRIHVENQCVPWSPSAHSRLRDVFHSYDGPRIGVVEQHGVKYLFACLAGESHPVSFWGYGLVHDAQVAELNTVDPDDFDATLARIVEQNGLDVVALAREYDDAGGILIAAPMDDPITQLSESFRQGMERIEAALAEINNGMKDLAGSYAMLAL